jgi:hypothetical protein
LDDAALALKGLAGTRVAVRDRIPA